MAKIKPLSWEYDLSGGWEGYPREDLDCEAEWTIHVCEDGQFEVASVEDDFTSKRVATFAKAKAHCERIREALAS